MKLQNLLINSLVTSLTLITFSCSTAPAKKSKEPVKAETRQAEEVVVPSTEAKQLAHEQETTLVTEFAFTKGSDSLNTRSKKKLDELSKEALKKGQIEMIKIITWADLEYPSPDKKTLPQKQIALANNRNSTIKNYLKKTNAVKDADEKIEVISMAERPTFYNKLISSDDARIKRSLETTGTKKKTSRSIVLILLKQ